MSREAMKLALEALETSMYPQQKQLQAITALREALAEQPAQPMHPEIKKMYEDYFDKCFRESSAAVPENFMDALKYDVAKRDFWEGYVPEPDKRQQALNKKAENARELGLDYEPAQQEPVLQDIEQYRLQMAGISTAAIGYWKESDGIHPDYDTIALRDVAKLYAKYDELYRAQRTWVGLTDEEIEKGRDQTFSINNPYCPCDSKTMRKAVRWAEAKLKEKNT